MTFSSLTEAVLRWWGGIVYLIRQGLTWDHTLRSRGPQWNGLRRHGSPTQCCAWEGPSWSRLLWRLKLISSKRKEDRFCSQTSKTSSYWSVHFAEVYLTLIKWLQEGTGFAEINWEEQILSTVTNLLPTKLILKVSDGRRQQPGWRAKPVAAEPGHFMEAIRPLQVKAWTSLLVGASVFFFQGFPEIFPSAIRRGFLVLKYSTWNSTFKCPFIICSTGDWTSSLPLSYIFLHPFYLSKSFKMTFTYFVCVSGKCTHCEVCEVRKQLPQVNPRDQNQVTRFGW